MTTPLPAAKIGVPAGAAQSTPGCMRAKCKSGWKRMPNAEVISPSAIGFGLSCELGRAQRNGRVDAAVADRTRRLELIVGVDRDAGDPRLGAPDRRFVGKENDFLPFADRRIAAPDAESGRDGGGVFSAC